MSEAQKTYREFIDQHHTELSILRKRKNRTGWLRLAVFLLTMIVSYQVVMASGIYALIPLIGGIAILLGLVNYSTNLENKIRNLELLSGTSEDELSILEHNYTHRYDGASFLPHDHDYAHDIDLFAEGSIYQWLNRCYTEQGRALLANNLLHPLDVEKSVQRQEAIKELAPMVAWRQQLQAFAIRNPVTHKTEKSIVNWLSNDAAYKSNPKIFIFIYSLITLGVLAATILGYIPFAIFMFAYIIFFIIAGVFSRKAGAGYSELNGVIKEVETISELIKWIEGKSFTSPLLQQLQSRISQKKEPAHKAIQHLKKILDRFDLRHHILGPLFLNTFLLWDLRQMLALDRWRNQHKTVVPEWFHTIAEAEVLNSLASFRFNDPDTCWPVFKEAHGSFRATGMAHPLIPKDKQVTNDFTIDGKGKIALVTGSNMAGKSTFLRSVAVNIVLARMGAPACCTMLELSPLQLMSSMRVSDNLNENTSTFLAELKKLKSIITAVNEHRTVLILLDEILRGTNSYDRHLGSDALIRQLVKQQAMAVVASHDLELTKLEDDFPTHIDNYHFDVEVQNEQMYFDYKLKEGVCKTVNAYLLMKNIGIEFEEGNVKSKM